MHSCPALSLSTQGGPTLIGMFKPSTYGTTCAYVRSSVQHKFCRACGVSSAHPRQRGRQDTYRLPKAPRHRHSQQSTPNKVSKQLGAHINMQINACSDTWHTRKRQRMCTFLDNAPTPRRPHEANALPSSLVRSLESSTTYTRKEKTCIQYHQRIGLDIDTGGTSVGTSNNA